MTSDSPKELTRNDPEWIRQFSREKAEIDRVSEMNFAAKKGFAEGFAKGFAESFSEVCEADGDEVRIATVKAMLNNGISPRIIAETIDMSIEDINKLTQ